MNSVVHRLVQSVTGKESLQACSVAELEQLAAQYQSFGPAQLLLAFKLKEEDASRYPEQARKALLYFSEPLWYDYVTTEKVVGGQWSVVGQSPIAIGSEVDQPAARQSEDNDVSGESGAVAGNDDLVTDVPAVAEVIAPEVVESTGNRVHSSEEAVVPPAAEADEFDEDETEVDDPEGPGTRLSIALPPFNPGTAEISDTALAFEPYHTIDYFASQGIRSADTDKPGDRFSRQLKSFTEWLKAMKKLPDAEAETGTQPAASDHKVEQMAEHSLDNREILTETMAEVWEKQGNAEKAIETYRKLSLLNPAKSAYFAAKIEHLKQL